MTHHTFSKLLQAASLGGLLSLTPLALAVEERGELPLDELRTFAKQVLANSAFSHAANKRLLEATDADPLDSGLQWEVMENEGVGPDMHDRISAFMKK